MRKWWTQMMDEEPLAFVGLLLLAVISGGGIYAIVVVALALFPHH